MNIIKYYLLFWFFAIIGWLLEVLVCSCYDKKLVNRGFLIGPYCPIYGFGALLMLLLNPYKEHPLIIFVLSLFMCSVLEYLTSFFMEKLFKIRWWDYSHDSFNINGRVCLRNALAFGALGVLFIRCFNPFFFSLIQNISDKKLSILAVILLIITTIDLIVSLKAMISIKGIVYKNYDSLKNKDATDDIKKLINVKYLERRLIKTYHLFEKEKDLLFNRIEKGGYHIILFFAFVGIGVGIFIAYLYQYSYVKVVSLCVSICFLIAILIIRWRE